MLVGISASNSSLIVTWSFRCKIRLVAQVALKNRLFRLESNLLCMHSSYFYFIITFKSLISYELMHFFRVGSALG